MVDYETYCRIRDHLVRQQLTPAQTARALGLDTRTVAKWAEVEQFRARQPRPRPSKLDAFKGQIVRWLRGRGPGRIRPDEGPRRTALRLSIVSMLYGILRFLKAFPLRLTHSVI